jgi:hypothetical protein
MSTNGASETFWDADNDQVTDADWLHFLGDEDRRGSGHTEPVTLDGVPPSVDPPQLPSVAHEGDSLDWLTTTALDDLLPEW